MESVTDFLFLASKITANSACIHKIKRCLVLGRKATTNLHSILKNRDITLLTVYIVKAIIFPVIMHRCWNFDYKIGSALKNWFFWIVLLEKILINPFDSKEIRPVNSKENQPWIFTERADTELKFHNFGHLIQRANLLEKTLMLGQMEGGRRRGWQVMRWLDGIINSMDMSLS